MNSPAGSAVPPTDRGAGSRRPGVSHRQALRVGLAVSVAVHVIGLALYPTVGKLDVRSGPSVVLPASVRAIDGMTVIEVVEVDATDDPERPADPQEVRPVEGPAVRPGAPDVGDRPGDVLIAPGPTAAERLRPRLLDGRVWAPLDPELNALTPEQIQELELAGRIAEWNDSLQAELDAQARGTDWTKTDAQGRKWGVSPGKLHLGDITLPLPFGFAGPVGRRDETRRAAWEWDEIQRGAATGELRDSWKDRAQAIRERRDRERATQTRPDTTGARR